MKEVQECSEKIGEERGRKIGEARGAKGIIELGKELYWSDNEIVSYLQQKLEISKEEAKKYLEMFEN